jgi:hypothetical protein
MKRYLWLGLFWGMILLSPAGAPAAGDIYVGGPYGTKITSVPYTIDTPGCYYLTSNLSYSLGYDSAIYVNADDVTLDLQGFALTGPSGSYGITWGQHKNIEIRNGTITGFYMGVWGNDTLDGGGHHRIFNLRTEGNTYGIWMNGNDILINGCTATQGSFGSGAGLTIANGTGVISDCKVMNFNVHGIKILKGIVSGNVVKNCGYGILAGYGNSTTNLICYNQVIDCTRGIEFWSGSVVGNTVTNCRDYGIVSSDTPGMPALVDQNTVTGPGNHYNFGGNPQFRNNAGYP